MPKLTITIEETDAHAAGELVKRIVEAFAPAAPATTLDALKDQVEAAMIAKAAEPRPARRKKASA